MKAFLLATAILLLAACDNNHHDGVGPADHAPVIFNLTVTPLTPLVFGTRAVYEFRVDFVDPDGHLAGGTCEVDTSIGFAELPLTAGGTDPHATTGIAICLFDVTVLGRVVTGSFRLTDHHGHHSNAIGFTLAAETSRAPGGPNPQPSVVGRSASIQRRL